MAHVAEYKKKIVADLVSLFSKYSIVAVADMENLPAPQLQKILAKLRDKLVLRMTKKRLMKLAIEKAKETKKHLEELEQYLTGMPALIFTNEDPFNLQKTLSQSKSKAPAKAGQIAPFDLVIPAGPTPFAPGPVISELAAVGIKSAVEGGKVAVKADTVVAKKGEPIKPAVASLLTRLDIKPMEIGLNLTAAYEKGTIYSSDVLIIDEKVYLDNIAKAHSQAFSLAIEAGILTKETAELMIQKAYNGAKAIAIAQNILVDFVVEGMIAEAESQMKTLKSQLKIEEKPFLLEKEKPSGKRKLQLPLEKKEGKEKEEKVVETKEETKPEVKEELKVEIKEEEKPQEIKEEKKEEKVEEKQPEVKEEPKVEEKPKEEPKEEVKEEKPQEKEEEKKEKFKEEVEKIEKIVEEIKKKGTAKAFEKKKQKETKKGDAKGPKEDVPKIAELAKKKSDANKEV